MKITCDPAKREATLRERGLDFLDAVGVFAGDHINVVDDRFDYGEFGIRPWAISTAG